MKKRVLMFLAVALAPLLHAGDADAVEKMSVVRNTMLIIGKIDPTSHPTYTDSGWSNRELLSTDVTTLLSMEQSSAYTHSDVCLRIAQIRCLAGAAYFHITDSANIALEEWSRDWDRLNFLAVCPDDWYYGCNYPQ